MPQYTGDDTRYSMDKRTYSEEAVLDQAMIWPVFFFCIVRFKHRFIYVYNALLLACGCVVALLDIIVQLSHTVLALSEELCVL